MFLLRDLGTSIIRKIERKMCQSCQLASKNVLADTFFNLDARLAHDSKILQLFCNHFTRARRVQCVFASREHLPYNTHPLLVGPISTDAQCQYGTRTQKQYDLVKKTFHVNVFQLKTNIFLRTVRMKHNEETV